jgi:hypothetical protein
LCDIGEGLLNQSVVVTFEPADGSAPREERVWHRGDESIADHVTRAIAIVTRRGDEALTVVLGGSGDVLWKASRR